MKDFIFTSSFKPNTSTTYIGQSMPEVNFKHKNIRVLPIRMLTDVTPMWILKPAVRKTSSLIKWNYSRKLFYHEILLQPTFTLSLRLTCIIKCAKLGCSSIAVQVLGWKVKTTKNMFNILDNQKATKYNLNSRLTNNFQCLSSPVSSLKTVLVPHL